MTLNAIGEISEIKRFHDYLLSKIPGNEIDMEMDRTEPDNKGAYRWSFMLKGVKEKFFNKVIEAEANKFFKEFGVEGSALESDEGMSVTIIVGEEPMARAIWGSSTGAMMEVLGDEIGDWLINAVGWENLLTMQPAWEAARDADKAAKEQPKQETPK